MDLVRNFDAAVINTHKGISSLKDTASNISENLKGYIAKAEELINDLSFMTDSSSKSADRLEEIIEQSRKLEQQVKATKITKKPSVVKKTTKKKVIKQASET